MRKSRRTLMTTCPRLTHPKSFSDVATTMHIFPPSTAHSPVSRTRSFFCQATTRWPRSTRNSNCPPLSFPTCSCERRSSHRRRYPYRPTAPRPRPLTLPPLPPRRARRVSPLPTARQIRRLSPPCTSRRRRPNRPTLKTEMSTFGTLHRQFHPYGTEIRIKSLFVQAPHTVTFCNTPLRTVWRLHTTSKRNLRNSMVKEAFPRRG